MTADYYIVSTAIDDTEAMANERSVRDGWSESDLNSMRPSFNMWCPTFTRLELFDAVRPVVISPRSRLYLLSDRVGAFPMSETWCFTKTGLEVDVRRHPRVRRLAGPEDLPSERRLRAMWERAAASPEAHLFDYLRLECHAINRLVPDYASLDERLNLSVSYRNCRKWLRTVVKRNMLQRYGMLASSGGVIFRADLFDLIRDDLPSRFFYVEACTCPGR